MDIEKVEFDEYAWALECKSGPSAYAKALEAQTTAFGPSKWRVSASGTDVSIVVRSISLGPGGCISMLSCNCAEWIASYRNQTKLKAASCRHITALRRASVPVGTHQAEIGVTCGDLLADGVEIMKSFGEIPIFHDNHERRFPFELIVEDSGLLSVYAMVDGRTGVSRSHDDLYHLGYSDINEGITTALVHPYVEFLEWQASEIEKGNSVCTSPFHKGANEDVIPSEGRVDRIISAHDFLTLGVCSKCMDVGVPEL